MKKGIKSIKSKKPIDNNISSYFIESIRSRLDQGKIVRRTLPMNGRLHIDRTLPFLIVYRRPVNKTDTGTDVLVKGEASYLIAPGRPKYKLTLIKLVKTIVETLSKKCNGFLIIEIWTNPDEQTITTDNPDFFKPFFRIITSPDHPPTRSIEVFEEALKRIQINRQPASVEIVYDKKYEPRGFNNIISEFTARKLDCFIFGLEVKPVFRNPETGQVYPLILRKLHQGVSRALKKALFEFSFNQTNMRPYHYQSLGRRAVVKAVWDVDTKLAEISSLYDFLLLSTPVNTEAAFRAFQKNRFNKSPVFYYRPRSIDPSRLKYKLHDIQIGRIEDPTLANIFYEKRREIDRHLSMLTDRDSKSFFYGSLQLYGVVDEDLLQLAEDLLHAIPPHSHEKSADGFLNATKFAEYAKQEIEYYRQFNSQITSTVQIRNDTVGLMVSRGNLLISPKVAIPVTRCNALLQHEIGTHILTYFNGRSQPFKLLYCGLTGYEELQEGIAVLAEYFAGGLNKMRFRILAGRVIAAYHMINNATFIDTFRILNHDYGFTQRTSFIITTRIYRAGGLTKDIVYLRGLVKLLNYLKKHKELDPLFVGKIGLEHVEIIKELQLRKVLHPIPLRPRYLENDLAKEKLKKLKDGMLVINLIGG